MKNIKLMYWMQVIGGILFFLPILALYYEASLFTATNIAIIFAVESIAMALFEIPTGAISDLFGRKRTIVIAHIIALIALVFLAIGGSMIMFILYACINAFARALTSGTDSALIYDTLKDHKQEHSYKKVIGTYQAIWPIGATIGSIIGGYLAATALSLPIKMTFIPLGITFILSLFLTEPKYDKEEISMFKHIKETTKFIFKHKQLLLIMLGVLVMLAFGEAIHYLKPLFLEFKNIPIIYFGIVVGFVHGASSLGHYMSHTISEKIGNKITLLISVILSGLLTILAVYTQQYIAVLFLILASIPFGLRNPVINHMLNKEISSSKRATVISTSNFMSRIGMAIFIPIVGYWTDIFSINTAYLISGIIMFSVIGLWVWLKE